LILLTLWDLLACPLAWFYLHWSLVLLPFWRDVEEEGEKRRLKEVVPNEEGGGGKSITYENQSYGYPCFQWFSCFLTITRFGLMLKATREGGGRYVIEHSRGIMMGF
jgi:hypothetical protein